MEINYCLDYPEDRDGKLLRNLITIVTIADAMAEARTDLRGLAIRNGAQVPNKLHIFLSSSVVPLFASFTN
jgi:hypothetical protein